MEEEYSTYLVSLFYQTERLVDAVAAMEKFSNDLALLDFVTDFRHDLEPHAVVDRSCSLLTTSPQAEGSTTDMFCIASQDSASGRGQHIDLITSTSMQGSVGIPSLGANHLMPNRQGCTALELGSRLLAKTTQGNDQVNHVGGAVSG